MPKAKPRIKAPYASTPEALGRSLRAFRPIENAHAGPEPGVIKALDVFSGAGGFASALMRACRENGVEVPLSVLNHWSTALETARLNLGAIKVFNCSISDVNPRDVVPDGYLDILLASPECFPAGTLVLTDKGLIPIESIHVGDRVLTHKGRYRKVVATRKQMAKDTVLIKGHGHPGLTTTPNHPFYIRQRSQRWNNPSRRHDNTYSDAAWKAAESLSTGSYWAIPTSFPSLPILRWMVEEWNSTRASCG